MAKIEWSVNESQPQRTAMELVATLAAHALGMAAIARAENMLLRQMMAEHNIELDDAQFKKAWQSHQAEILGDYLKRYPEMADVVPSIESLMARGVFTLDP
jgi:hypothetical protein